MDTGALTPALLGASTVQTVGTVIAVLTGLIILTYAGFNMLAGRREVGSEIELAPNRKPYLDDEQLETNRLNRTLLVGLALLLILAVGLPLYWLHEPGRQEGAVENFQSTFVARGEERYLEGSQCADCHGPDGGGGAAPYQLTDDDGEFVASISWRAPALDSAPLRFSREEIAYIIEYGRPGTPMVGWGEGGNGPLTSQQIDNLVDFMFDIQLEPEEVQREIDTELAIQLGYLESDETDEAAIDEAIAQIDYAGDPQVGEALFNMGGESGLAAGAYSCARCHTAGWSLVPEEGGEALVDPFVGRDGSGALGPALDDVVPRQFATVDALAEFVANGTDDGEGYGKRGQGSGKMPGFGENPNTDALMDGMYTREQLCAVALYAAGLPDGGEVPPLSTEEGSFCSEVLDAASIEEALGALEAPAAEDLEAESLEDPDVGTDPGEETVEEQVAADDAVDAEAEVSE